MQTPYKPDHEIAVNEPLTPFIPNLWNVLAVGSDPTSPLVTICRGQRTTAADWIANAVKQKRFEFYQLRFDEDDWEFFDGLGKQTGPFSCLSESRATESTTVVPVDRAAFLREARDLVEDEGLTLIACAEGHAGASAADHSNFEVVCRRMLAEASPADLEQVYLLDSRRWPCRVTGVFANVAKLSPTMQDVFLDRVKWIQNSWPMIHRDFRAILADRLAKLRYDYVSNLLQDCARSAGMPEERCTAMLAKWALASPGPRCRFARHIVETLAKGLVFQEGAAETFSPEIVESHGAAVVKEYEAKLDPSLK